MLLQMVGGLLACRLAIKGSIADVSHLSIEDKEFVGLYD